MFCQFFLPCREVWSLCWLLPISSEAPHRSLKFHHFCFKPGLRVKMTPLPSRLDSESPPLTPQPLLPNVTQQCFELFTMAPFGRKYSYDTIRCQERQGKKYPFGMCLWNGSDVGIGVSDIAERAWKAHYMSSEMLNFASPLRCLFLFFVFSIQMAQTDSYASPYSVTKSPRPSSRSNMVCLEPRCKLFCFAWPITTRDEAIAVSPFRSTSISNGEARKLGGGAGSRWVAVQTNRTAIRIHTVLSSVCSWFINDPK